MGNANCCGNDNRLDLEPQIIQPMSIQLSQEPLKIEQFLQNNPTVSRILQQKELKTMQQSFSQKQQFLEKCVSTSTEEGVFIGSKYIEKGTKNQYGIMLYRDRSYYQGEWLNDMKEGKGLLINESGEYYCGEWAQDMPNGYGVYCLLQPYTVYKGEWKNGVKNGQGSELSSDGSKYVGEFVNGEREGSGKIIYADKTQYTGELKKGQPDGVGYFKGKKSTYDGTWKDGKMHGSGTCCWLNEKGKIVAKYVGEYNEGIKQGYGEYEDGDGNLYKAMWVNGEINDHAPVDHERSSH